MKSIVFLYAGFVFNHAFDILFSEKSAFEKVLAWSLGIRDCSKIIIACNPETELAVKKILEKVPCDKTVIVTLPKWNTTSLLKEMALRADAEHADFAVYASADRPFLDSELTNEVIDCHVKYLAEYTFADGYPAGFSPEVISSGTLNIMYSLSTGKSIEAGNSPVSNDSLFNVLKGDVNAFEIETVIAPKDYRMLRLDLSCSSKANTMACKKLYEEAIDKGISFSAQSLSDLASEAASVQHTVPAFYNIQIAENCTSEAIYNPYIQVFAEKNGRKPLADENESPKNMSLEKFRCIVNDMSDFSESAVVDLSGFSDPLTHSEFPEFVKTVLEKKGLSVLIETDGSLVSLVLAKKIAEMSREAGSRSNGNPPVMWIVNVDSCSEQKYFEIHKKQGLKSAQEAVKILENFFPGCVYPQLLRMHKNEDELESFYRFYHDKESPSKGNLIIQKYDHYCGFLSDEKPADLSPIKRCPCWHLKRDMFILPDGSVPLCREYILDNIIGNVFVDGIENIWKKNVSLVNEHIHSNYSEKCGSCDEYYTFNF
ncbi:MAG: spiro-SPASM protein [Treponema sp.]|nr:spiro-SPASM protein [Treponema sp.]